MKTTPLVSVIVPNYNHARFLEQRLDSVFNQTYQNFEVIILDDKSTDNSLEVIDRYKDNPHLSQIVANKTNSGSAFSQWDKGISLAKGEIIWIAESDDYCELNLLEELVKAYTHRNNTVVAYSTVIGVDENSKPFGADAFGRNQYMSGKQYIKRYLTIANFVKNMSCAIFSKKAALKISPNYKTYKGAGDYLFWVEIAMQGNVAIVNKRLSYFRRHGTNVTEKRNADGTNYIEEKRILDYICSFMHISYLRMQGILYMHASRIKNIEFENNTIKEQIYDLWDIHDEYPFTQLVVKKIMSIMRKHFNIYI